uniref:Uncharacterized protein n=1 Tax=Solanum lycopersicum TaxID=4081 RepID=A0A3Q7IDG0_SOLLC
MVCIEHDVRLNLSVVRNWQQCPSEVCQSSLRSVRCSTSKKSPVSLDQQEEQVADRSQCGCAFELAALPQ